MHSAYGKHEISTEQTISKPEDLQLYYHDSIPLFLPMLTFNLGKNRNTWSFWLLYLVLFEVWNKEKERSDAKQS